MKIKKSIKPKTLPWGNLKEPKKIPITGWVHKFKYKKGTMMAS